MMEVAFDVIFTDLVEVVHVKLSDEGRIVTVFEITRQDLL